MESQDKQPPTKVKWGQGLWDAYKNNKDDSVRELPISVRFLIKSLALMAHHKHLKPVEDHNFIITIPLPVLKFVHSVIGVVLLIFLIRVTYDSFKWWLKKIRGIKKDMQDKTKERKALYR